jgi:hypothetical protein
MAKRLTINDVWGMAQSSLKACQEHNETTNKMATMNSELWNEIGFKQSKAHTDQLWDLAKLEEKISKLEKENEELREFAGGVVQVEKKIKQHTKQESVDN